MCVRVSMCVCVCVCVYVMGGVDEDITNSASICSRKLRGFHACIHVHSNMCVYLSVRVCVSVYACMCVVSVCVCLHVWPRVYTCGCWACSYIHIQPWQKEAVVASDATYADVC